MTISLLSFQEILKTVRAILNKLTPEKFQTLIKQIVNLKLDTFDRLKRAIDLIFEKVSETSIIPPPSLFAESQNIKFYLSSLSKW